MTDETMSFMEASDPNLPLNKAYPILKGHTINVHNHGYVRLVDWMGTDRSITEAARVSYGATNKTQEEDKRLLARLFKDKHTSPFEMCKVVFNIRMPIFVMRQFVRHRMQNLNEFSMRYKEPPDFFFTPEKWRKQSKSNKQGSEADDSFDADNIQDFNRRLDGLYAAAYDLYKFYTTMGVAREQARIVLPVGIFTEIYTCWDLNNLLKYFALRDDPHAQGEHQDYAKAMKEITRMVFPWVMEIYENRML